MLNWRLKRTFLQLFREEAGTRDETLPFAESGLRGGLLCLISLFRRDQMIMRDQAVIPVPVKPHKIFVNIPDYRVSNEDNFFVSEQIPNIFALKPMRSHYPEYSKFYLKLFKSKIASS